MNKRGLQLLLVISTFLLSSTSVAADTSTLADMMNALWKIFGTFSALGANGFKFLLWIALFTLIDYGLKKASFSAKVSGVIAFVMSIATILMIPGSAIIKIFSLYSFLVVTTLGLIVPLILFWTIHRGFPGDELEETLIRAALYIIIGIALIWFAGNANGLLVFEGGKFL